jgi:hypothetical protein
MYCWQQYSCTMNRDQMLQIRLTEDEKRGFQAAADLAGLPLAFWTRERLRHAAIRELERAGQKVPFVATFDVT